ncbi:MAG: hypothetical protein KC912_23625 [Proteobacteria bacterium]|nr:hypothetical protein [Pseudomonadota bacterium]
MPSCELAVILENPEATFKPGDVVRGFITVDVSDAVKCRGLHVRLLVRTHGRGNRWEREHGADLLFEGNWNPGEQQLYPFEFVVPPGPVSYRGNLLNVSWYVYSYVDIPWGFDPEVTEEITVIAGDEPVELGPVHDAALPDFSAAMSALPATAVFGAGIMVMAFGLLPALMIGVCEGDLTAGMFSAILVVPSFGLGAYLIYRALRNRMAERRLGDVRFEVDNPEATCGDTLSFSVQLSPEAPVQVTRAVLTLQAEEVVVSGSGTNKKTHRHMQFTRELPLHEGGELVGPVHWNTEITIPEDAPPSFGAPCNNLSWQAELHIDIPRWPDWMRKMALRIHPRPS